jgi:hypothetical protein
MPKRNQTMSHNHLEEPFDTKLHNDTFLTSYLNSFNFVELNLGTDIFIDVALLLRHGTGFLNHNLLKLWCIRSILIV